MSTKISSGISYSTNYYLRDFYSNNRDAFKSTKRNDFSRMELVYEDSLALKKASHKLINRRDSYNNDTSTSDNKETDENTINTIKAYVDVYNNAIDSSKDSDKMKRYAKQLKKLSSQYAEELEDIGITTESDGKLKINDNLLKTAGSEKVDKVFGKDIGYTKKIRMITRNMNNAAFDDLYSSITGNGTKINLSL